MPCNFALDSHQRARARLAGGVSLGYCRGCGVCRLGGCGTRIFRGVDRELLLGCESLLCGPRHSRNRDSAPRCRDWRCESCVRGQGCRTVPQPHFDRAVRATAPSVFPICRDAWLVHAIWYPGSVGWASRRDDGADDDADNLYVDCRRPAGERLLLRVGADQLELPRYSSVPASRPPAYVALAVESGRSPRSGAHRLRPRLSGASRRPRGGVHSAAEK